MLRVFLLGGPVDGQAGGRGEARGGGQPVLSRITYRIIQKIYAVPRGGKLLFVFHRRPLLPLLLPERKIEVDDANKVMFDKPLEPRPGFARITLEAPSRRPEEGVLDAIAKKLPVARLIFDTSKFNGLDVGGGRYQIAKDGWVWEKRGLDTLFASRSERYRH